MNSSHQHCSVDVRIITDKSGVSKGYCFVDMRDDEEGEIQTKKLLKQKNMVYGNHNIVFKPAYYFFFKIFSTEKIFHCFRSLTSYLSKSWLYVTNLTASSSILRFSNSDFRLQELALKLSPRRNCTTQTQRLTVQMNLNPCQLTVTLPPHCLCSLCLALWCLCSANSGTCFG